MFKKVVKSTCAVALLSVCIGGIGMVSAEDKNQEKAPSTEQASVPKAKGECIRVKNETSEQITQVRLKPVGGATAGRPECYFKNIYTGKSQKCHGITDKNAKYRVQIQLSGVQWVNVDAKPKDNWKVQQTVIGSAVKVVKGGKCNP